MSRANGEATVREVATVTVTQTVDGTGRRRRARAMYNRKATPVDGFTVDKRVMAAAQKSRRPNMRIIPVSPTEVLIVNRTVTQVTRKKDVA
jgi:hypothetical protein